MHLSIRPFPNDLYRLVTVLMLLVLASVANAQTGKTGFVNMNDLYQQYSGSKQIEKERVDAAKQSHSELEAKQAALWKQYPALQTPLPDPQDEITSTNLQELQKALEKKKAQEATLKSNQIARIELEKKQIALAEEFRLKDQQAHNVYQKKRKAEQEKITAAIRSIATARGYTAILDASSAVILGPEDDLTVAVLDMLEKNRK